MDLEKAYDLDFLKVSCGKNWGSVRAAGTSVLLLALSFLSDRREREILHSDFILYH